MTSTVLILAPHTDDGEFGCGGTIARLTAQGDRVVYVAFSAAEDSVPDEFPKDILRQESKLATAALGIADEDCIVLDYQVRRFPENRQAILDDMIRLRNEYRPDRVFLPSSDDTHQDHATVAAEGYRAFKMTTIYGYEIPWNNPRFPTTAFFELQQEHLDRKIAALECYDSQSHRNYASAEFVRSLAITRGTQIGRRYAEAFEMLRWIA